MKQKKMFMKVVQLFIILSPFLYSGGFYMRLKGWGREMLRSRRMPKPLHVHEDRLEYRRELHKLKRCSTAQLLDEYKNSDIYIAGFIDRNELEHRLALKRVKESIASANQPSKRHQAYLLKQELDKLRNLTEQEIMEALITRKISFSRESNDDELRVLLAKSNLLRQDSTGATAASSEWKLDSLFDEKSLEGIKTVSDQFSKTVSMGVQEVVDGATHTFQDLISTEAEKEASKAIFQPLNAKVDKREDVGEEADYSGVSGYVWAQQEATVSDMDSLLFELSIQPTFESIVKWSKSKTKRDIIALLEHKGLKVSGMSTLPWLVYHLADAEMAERSSILVEEEALKDELVVKKRKPRSWQTDSFAFEKDMWDSLRKDAIPTIIVHGFNFLSFSCHSLVTGIFKVLNIQITSPNSPLSLAEKALMSLSSIIIQQALRLGQWAGSGRVEKKIVLFFCTVYAIFKRGGMKSFLSALVGMKLFTLLLKVSAMDLQNSSKDISDSPAKMH